MARVLYFDCFSGISGDMVLGAFLDAGLPLGDLQAALGSLAVSGYRVGAERVLRAGVASTRFTVDETAQAALPQVHAPAQAQTGDGAHDHSHDHAHGHPHDHPHDHPHGHSHDDPQGHSHSHPHDHPHGHLHDDVAVHSHTHSHSHAHAPHRSLPEIVSLIERSALSVPGKAQARGMFQRLAEAEAAIHQMPVEQVHLHEVGALDSIIDIVGAVFAMEWARADRVVCSPLNVGGGMVQSAHGLFPVPAPATVKLLGRAPVYSGAVQKELVTPTGALVATTYATAYGPIPAMTIDRVGYGAGSRDNAGTPNVLRLLIGETTDDPSPVDRVAVIECEIDDMNPQLFGTAMERLYAAGALEVFYVPVQMKKNRPGTLLTVLCAPEQRAALSAVVFRETTTIGLRYTEVERECLRREVVQVGTPLGPVRFKQSWRDGRIVNAVPEFEDCVALAKAGGLSVKDVHAIAVRAYGARPGEGSVPL